MRGLKLKIEPIPNFTWGISLANKLPKEEWDKLRQQVYRDANYTCEICGATGGVLHCHEVWKFDDKRKIQRLIKLECCCDLCHDVHHFGRTKAMKPWPRTDRCINHWCKVNGRTIEDFRAYEKELKEVNYKRAEIAYIVKIGRRILV